MRNRRNAIKVYLAKWFLDFGYLNEKVNILDYFKTYDDYEKKSFKMRFSCEIKKYCIFRICYVLFLILNN